MILKSLAGHFATVGAGTIISALIGFITVPIITRIVSPSSYGEFTIFTTYAGIFVMVLSAGQDQALMRFYNIELPIIARHDVLVKCSRIIGVVLSIFFLAVALLVMAGIHFPFDSCTIALLGACVVFQIITRLNNVLFRLELKTRLFAGMGIVYRLLYLLLSCGFLLSGFMTGGFIALVWAFLISYAAVAFLGLVFQRNVWFKRGENKPKGISVKELLTYGAPFIVSMTFMTLFEATGKLSVDFFLGYSEVGIYAGALAIISAFSIVQVTFTTLWAPESIKRYERNREDKSFLLRGYQLICFLMFSLGSVLILAKDLIVLLLGPAYLEGATLIPCLAFGPIMYTISETTVSGIAFMKKSYLHIVVTFFSLAINSLCNVLLIPLLGVKGSAIAAAISYVCFFWLRTLLSRRVYSVDYELSSMITMTIVFFAYSLTQTFVNNLLINIIGFSICILMVCILFKRGALDLFGIMLSLCKEKAS